MNLLSIILVHFYYVDLQLEELSIMFVSIFGKLINLNLYVLCSGYVAGVL